MRTIPVLLVAAVLVTGCGSAASSGDGKVHVVASFFPLAEAAAKVGGGAVEVEDLTQPGAEPHDLELTTRQVDHLLDADVALVLGHGFQPDVEDAADSRDLPTVVVLDALGLHGDVGEDGDGLDPHVWLDPTKMRAIVRTVADALATADPDHEADYRRRASTYVEQLDALADRYRRGLTRCRTHTIVTAHAAFGWLAKAFGLREESIAGISPEQEPDPRRLATLVDLVRDEDVSTVFTEALLSPKVARTLAREAGATTEVLDPIEGLSKDDLAAGKGYVSVMDGNLTKLRAALGCR
jgi:zinc transport system substrate-binding protein